jgi:hypothetical protein
MDDEVKISLIAFLIVAALYVGITYVSGTVSCGNRWERSGHNSEYGLFQGCLVERADGTWIPEDAVRDVSDLDMNKEIRR